MKPIYIRSGEKRSKNLLTFFLIFIIFLLAVRVFAPFGIREYVNRSGSDERGYAFKIGDVNLGLLKGKVEVESIDVFNAKTKVKFAEAEDVVMDFNWRTLFDDKKKVSFAGKEMNITISRDFFEEINRVKNEARKESESDLYLDRLEGKIDTINFFELKDDKSRNLLTLKNAEAELRDLGLGDINEKTEFSLASKIAEGGNIDISGKTRLESNATPWEIQGNLKGIPGGVIEKLAGDRLPLDIEKASINATITAQSSGGQVEGVVEPDINDLKFSDKKEEGFFKRNLAKAANFLFEKAEDSTDLQFKLPFTLNQNFTLNIPETIEKISK